MNPQAAESTESSNEVLSKVREVANVLNEYQQTASNNDVKLHNLSEKSADLLTQINNANAKIEKQEKVIKNLEASLNKIPSQRSSNDESVYKKCPIAYHKILDSCLRIRDKTGFRNVDENLTRELVKHKLSHTRLSDFAKSKTVTRDVLEGDNTAGGFLVFPELVLDPTVARDLETTNMRDICGSITLSTNQIKLPIDDQLTESGGQRNEVEQTPVTQTPDLGQLTISVHSQKTWQRITQDMIDDAALDIVGWLQRKIFQSMTLLENAKFLNGTGSQEARGILDYPAWGGAPVIENNDLRYQRGACRTHN